MNKLWILFLETHRGLILRTPSSITLNSQDECTLSLLWAFHDFATPGVSLLWLFERSSQWAHHAVVAVSSLWVGLLWVHQVSSLWSDSDASWWDIHVRTSMIQIQSNWKKVRLILRPNLFATKLPGEHKKKIFTNSYIHHFNSDVPRSPLEKSA